MTRYSSISEKISDFLFGAFLASMHAQSLGVATKYKDAVDVLLFGRVLGIPMMNSYFTIRLAPNVIGELRAWKRRSLREKDPLDTFFK